MLFASRTLSSHIQGWCRQVKISERGPLGTCIFIWCGHDSNGGFVQFKCLGKVFGFDASVSEQCSRTTFPNHGSRNLGLVESKQSALHFLLGGKEGLRESVTVQLVDALTSQPRWVHGGIHSTARPKDQILNLVGLVRHSLKDLLSRDILT